MTELTLTGGQDAPGMPFEAVVQDLCNVRTAVETLILRTDVVIELLVEIRDAVQAGTAKADEGIAAAQASNAAIDALRLEVKRDVDDRTASRGT